MRTTHHAPAHSSRHARRRCLACGLPTDAGTDRHACPRCGCDFGARPPRSYAEMEGLDALPDVRDAEADLAAARADVAATRWLLVVGGITAMAALAVAATLAVARG